MIHPVNQAFDLIAWSGRRLAWPAIYVIYVIRGHLGKVPKRDSLNQPFGMTSGGPLWPVPSPGPLLHLAGPGALKKVELLGGPLGDQ